ncbi:MAG: SDR family NAD(P)-dependent oxidoreductase [Planctomycetota bacterium]|nr:SDR family NAD(P)-dependent oxidoreductase [Planctomycetota bacterium]MDA1106008.1 SDR family NAD(P)-dependent oxidoreductase [Planctomycetota bacterium]
MSSKDALPFNGLEVMVTGGTGVVGRAVCEALLVQGAQVHATGVLDTESDAFAKAFPAVRLHRVDLTDARHCHEAFSSLPSLWASIHCAGGFVYGAIGDATDESVTDMFDMNALTAFNASRQAVRVMRERASARPEKGDPRTAGGRIVNIAGRPAVEPAAGFSAYAMAKSAVIALTRTLAVELAPEGILVNAVVPSVIDTPINRAAMPGADFTKWVQPSELASQILLLASPASHATGQVVPVYGGLA